MCPDFYKIKILSQGSYQNALDYANLTFRRGFINEEELQELIDYAKKEYKRKEEMRLWSIW